MTFFPNKDIRYKEKQMRIGPNEECFVRLLMNFAKIYCAIDKIFLQLFAGIECNKIMLL